jgi:hypothetical protein
LETTPVHSRLRAVAANNDAHFIVAYRNSWQDLLDGDAQGVLPPSPRELAPRIINNEDCWVVMTYVHLRRRGLPVRLRDAFVPGEICVASSLDYGIRARPDRSLVIACRGDGPRSILCDFQVVQNPLNVWSKRDFLIPLWPQPDLLPRDPARGDRVRTIVYKGDINNLHQTFRSDAFVADLAKRGVHLALDRSAKSDRVAWGDYRDADLLLAVRNLTLPDARVKPASKLLNAWHAGVPALLGPEPAFRALRRSELDYIEVRTPADALAAVDRLLAEPARYRAMVEQAARRAPELDDDAIAGLWIALLEAARQALPRRRRLPRPLQVGRFAGQAVLQKVFNYRSVYARTHGQRILPAHGASGR